MNLFRELKRRNVIRVAIAYAVVAWVFLQAVDFTLELIDAPGWVLQVFFLATAIGLIAAIIFAWVFEITPEGIQRETDVESAVPATSATGHKLDRVIIVFLALAVGGLLLERYWSEEQSVSAKAVETADAVKQVLDADDETPSVAVLPFVNMSPDPDNEYFSDGITEELLNLLVGVPDLRVPSRTSSFAFKGQNRDIREIAAELEVAHILEGSVRKAGNQVRITAQLIDVDTDTHLWSETFDRELADIFAVQDEIANEIVGALQPVLGTRVEHDRPTENLDAYSLYLQGLYLFQRRGSELLEAEQLLREAVTLDPGFADAWAILGLTLIMQPNYVNRPLDKVLPLALEAADRADALRPGMAEVFMIRGNAAAKMGHFAEMIRLQEQAVERHPQHSLAIVWYAIQLLNLGYLVEGESNLQMARQLDPASGLILDWLGRARVMLGQYKEAEKNLIRAMQLDRSQAVWGLGMMALNGHFEPTRLLELAKPADPIFIESIRLSIPVNASELAPEVAMQRVREFEKDALSRQYGQFVLASYTANANTMAATFPDIWPTDTSAISALWYPGLTEARNHPAIKTEMLKIGFPDVWRERGWPDLCRAAGEDGFECD